MFFLDFLSHGLTLCSPLWVRLSAGDWATTSSESNTSAFNICVIPWKLSRREKKNDVGLEELRSAPRPPAMAAVAATVVIDIDEATVVIATDDEKTAEIAGIAEIVIVATATGTIAKLPPNESR